MLLMSGGESNHASSKLQLARPAAGCESSQYKAQATIELCSLKLGHT